MPAATVKPFKGAGSTPRRKAFWNELTAIVNSIQKQAGRHVTVDVHPGRGTVINVAAPDQRGRRPQGIPPGPSGVTGACCVDGVCSITTEADCTGNYLGDGTTCEGVDCTKGACCDGSVCTLVDAPGTSCTGTYQGDGTVCDPNPCLRPISACCGSIFQAFDGSCRFFLTKTTVLTATHDDHGTPAHRTGTANITTVETYDPDTCAYSCSRSGSDSSQSIDTRNGCITLDCFTDTAQICGQWEDHRKTFNSHSGTGCTPVSDSHITNADATICPGLSLPNSGCCVLPLPFTCTNTAITSSANSSTANGTWSLVATLSDEVTCPTGACCNYDTHSCDIQTECECNNSGGVYQGDDTVCDPDPCGFAPPP